MTDKENANHKPGFLHDCPVVIFKKTQIENSPFWVITFFPELMMNGQPFPAIYIDLRIIFFTVDHYFMF